MTIAELIRARRDALKLNDEDAAEQLDISQPTFSRWRSGRSVPGDDRIDALAAWLNVPEDQVILAMAQGRRARPTSDPVTFQAEILGELRELRSGYDEVRAELERLRNQLHQEP